MPAPSPRQGVPPYGDLPYTCPTLARPESSNLPYSSTYPTLSRTCPSRVGKLTLQGPTLYLSRPKPDSSRGTYPIATYPRPVPPSRVRGRQPTLHLPGARPMPSRETYPIVRTYPTLVPAESKARRRPTRRSSRPGPGRVPSRRPTLYSRSPWHVERGRRPTPPTAQVRKTYPTRPKPKAAKNADQLSHSVLLMSHPASRGEV